jgi:hypothetical protein
MIDLCHESWSSTSATDTWNFDRTWSFKVVMTRRFSFRE